MTSRVKKNRERIEFGDFQTPDSLAREICEFLLFDGSRPESVVEPTCGKGSFIIASIKTFNSCKKFIAADINREYLEILHEKICPLGPVEVELKNADFFGVDWHHIFADLPEPLLIIGNPPWVTNSQIGCVSGMNLPTKSNFQNFRGLDALTGKANFDISEWMLIRLLDCVQDKDAVLAMLCKTSVARKVIRYAWQNNFRLAQSAMYIIDAKQRFNISAAACLLICKTGDVPGTKLCCVYRGLSSDNKIASIERHNAGLLADTEKYRKWEHLDGIEHCKWRSGVKHDCARVMELSCEGDRFRNGLGEICEIETDFLYPLFKSSNVAKNDVSIPKLWVLITQKNTGDDTAIIKKQAPKTWAYLMAHSDLLDSRKSSIYRKRSRFSIFGIGDYAFAPWKVSISGLYKKIHFSAVAPHKGKPSMVDDTCYYIPCDSMEEATILAELLNSDVAKEFMDSFIFWDSKRPITIDVLRRIDIAALAEELGVNEVPNLRPSLPFK